jgi:hypothetical protein
MCAKSTNPTTLSTLSLTSELSTMSPTGSTLWQKSRECCRPGGLLLFEEVPRRLLDSWALRTFTDHPRENRFEADEFADELARHGLHGKGRFEPRFGGGMFVGAARKS